MIIPYNKKDKLVPIQEQNIVRQLKLWEEILETLGSINEPSELLMSAIDKLSLIKESILKEELKTEIEGEIRYLIMRAHVDLRDFEDALSQKNHILILFPIGEDNDLVIRASYLEGRAYALQKNYSAAAKVWLDLLKKTTNQERLAQLLHEVGRCFFKMNQLNSAQEYGTLSLESAKKTQNNTWVKNAAILLAQLEVEKKNKKEALENYEVAEAAARQLGDRQSLVYIICESQKLGKLLRRPKSKEFLSR